MVDKESATSARSRQSARFRPDRLVRLAELERWHFWFVARRALIRSLLADRLGDPRQLIAEVGCGNGAMLAELVSFGHTVVGIDALPEALKAAGRAAPEARLLLADASDLPLESAVCDGVLLLDVLEHTDDRAALAEVARVLRPGGWVIVTVPAMPWLWSHRDIDAGHLRRYTRKGLGRTLRQAGFSVERLLYYQFFLFPLVVGTRLAGRWRPRARDFEEQPSRTLNGLLMRINLLEARLSTVCRWPFGSSLVAVCRKPDTE